MDDNTGTQALWPQMIAALAAIDDALGLPQDGCNATSRTIAAIHELQQAAQAAEENAYQARSHTPTLYSARQPLTERQIIGCIVRAGCLGTVKMTYEAGPYDVDRTSVNADRLVKEVERAHGIGLTPNARVKAATEVSEP